VLWLFASQCCYVTGVKVHRSALGQLTGLATGGFSQVFRVDEFLLPGDATPLAYKRFTVHHVEQARSAAAVVEFRARLTAAERGMLDRYAAWPRAIVEDSSGVVSGLLMPLIPPEFFSLQHDPATGRLVSTPRDMGWLIATAEQRNAAGLDLPEVKHSERLVLLAQLVFIIGWLHARGWVFGDLSYKNVVFALGPPRLMLLDCDGAAALSDFTRRQPSTIFWHPPEGELGVGRQELQDTVTDVYKLGLAILRCLTPGKGAATTKSVGRLGGLLDEDGADLVTRALSADRMSRPTSRELYDYFYRVASPLELAVLPRIDASYTPARPLAGVRSDIPSAEDLLGASSDAEMLADLIAATETAAPLAIALIGDWGTGKSSVMLQIQRRIDVLAEMSRNNPGQTVFATNVRQVRFNAWDYSDDHVCAGLTGQLFRALAAEPGNPASLSDPADAEADREALSRRLAEREAEEEQLSSALRTADAADRPAESVGLSSPAYGARVIAAAARELRRDARGIAVVLLAWAVLGAVAAGAWFLLGSLTGLTAAAVAAGIAPAVVIARRLRSWHRAGVDFIDAQRRRLDARQRILRREIAGLRERLALADATSRLSAFVAGRAAGDAYRDDRTLLGQVRNDLTQLSADLAQARREWLTGGASGAPPLERIVLYIDDLDRCPPHQVVEVLEAVHLMLALDLFVVVAAVDARWLLRSLEYHYSELFARDSGRAGPTADGSLASPADYLDKIFQIPYALAHPPAAAMASYLRSLLPLPAPSPQEQGQGTADTKETPHQAASPHSESSAPEDAHREPCRGSANQPLTSDRSPSIPDINPRGLQLIQREVDFMTRLSPVLPTPRAAKRLVNLYRLIRIGIPDTELSAFTGSESGGPYQVVQILLAFLVGSPAAAQRIFQDIMDASPDSDILTVLARTATEDGAGLPDCARLSAQLAAIARDTALLTITREYQRWCPDLARHSFHTRVLTVQASPPELDDAPASTDDHEPRSEHENDEPSKLVMPFYMICDTSDSVHDQIAAMHDGLERLRRSVVAEPVVNDVARFCVISFSDEAKVVAPLGRISAVPVLTAGGSAHYGRLFGLLAQRIAQDSQDLKARGYMVYRPCVFFLVASEPTDHDWHDTFMNTLAYDYQTGLGMREYPIFVPFGYRQAPESVLRQLAYPPGRVKWYHASNANIEDAMNGVLDVIMHSVVSSGRDDDAGRPLLYMAHGSDQPGTGPGQPGDDPAYSKFDSDYI
jgi:uncharacterized protein YegL